MVCEHYFVLWSNAPYVVLFSQLINFDDVPREMNTDITLAQSADNVAESLDVEGTIPPPQDGNN